MMEKVCLAVRCGRRPRKSLLEQMDLIKIYFGVLLEEETLFNEFRIRGSIQKNSGDTKGKIDEEQR